MSSPLFITVRAVARCKVVVGALLMSAVVFRFIAVSTACALAPFGTTHSELETLAVALETARLFTGASLSVLHLFATSYFCHFRLEGLRVSFHDIFFGYLS